MKKASELIAENAKSIIRASKSIPAGFFLYLDKDGNVMNCHKDSNPKTPFVIIGSRPLTTVNHLIEKYKKLEMEL